MTITITRKEACEIAEALGEVIQSELYAYWVPYKGYDIPFGNCIALFEAFITSTELKEMSITCRKVNKKL